MNFNIHNLLKFRVDGTNKRYLKYLSQDYSYFKTDETIEPDIDIIVSDFTPNNNDCYVVNHKYFIKENYLFCKDSHKVVRWKVCLKGLTKRKTTVHFSGSKFSEVFLRDYIIEPLIALKLATRGFSLLHASGIAINNKGFVFAGAPGAGKTAIILNLMDSSIFLNDEIALLSSDGAIYSFPSPICVYNRNLKSVPVREKMTLTNKIELSIKHLVYLLSLNYIKLPLRVNPEKFFGKVGKDSYPIHCLVLLRGLETNKVSIIDRVDKERLVEQLNLINRDQFGYFFQLISAYSSIYPESEIAPCQHILQDNLLKALKRASCYEIGIPSRYNQSMDKEVNKVLKAIGVL